MTFVRRAVGLGALLSIACGALASIGDTSALLRSVNQSTEVKQMAIKGSIGARLAQSNQLFLENKGQWPAEAKFLARYPGLNVWLTAKGWKLDQLGASTEKTRSGQ